MRRRSLQYRFQFKLVNNICGTCKMLFAFFGYHVVVVVVVLTDQRFFLFFRHAGQCNQERRGFTMMIIIEENSSVNKFNLKDTKTAFSSSSLFFTMYLLSLTTLCESGYSYTTSSLTKNREIDSPLLRALKRPRLLSI